MISKSLTLNFENCWSIREVPENCKTVPIFFFKEKVDPENYRSISFSSKHGKSWKKQQSIGLQALKKKKRWLLSTSIDCTRKILCYVYEKVTRLVHQGTVLDVM